MDPSVIDWATIGTTALTWVAAAVTGTAALFGAGLGLRSGIATLVHMVGKAFGR